LEIRYSEPCLDWLGKYRNEDSIDVVEHHDERQDSQYMRAPRYPERVIRSGLTVHL
jgi:hypothetical protein